MKQREFYIGPEYSDIKGCHKEATTWAQPGYIHVREVSPSRDALFEEMLGVLKKISDNYCQSRRDVELYGQAPIRKWADEMILKVEGKE